MQSLLSDRRSIVDFVTIEAKSYSDNAVPNKHCCDNSKLFSTEKPVLDKHSVAVTRSIIVLVHRLRLRSNDRLFVTNTANSNPLFSGWPNTVGKLAACDVMH
jgi:hypothetical protein